MKNTARFYSRIAARLSKKLTVTYLLIYLLILCSLLGILTPLLYRNTRKSLTQMQAIISDEYASLQEQLSECLNGFSGAFYDLLDAYQTDPSKKKRALIVQELSSYTSAYDHFASVAIQLPDGEYISSIFYRNLDTEALLSENRHYRNLLSSYSSSYYSPIYSEKLVQTFSAKEKQNDRFSDLLYYSKNISQGTDVYTLTVFYNISSFLANINTLDAAFFDEYLVMDKYQELIYGTDTSFSEALCEHLTTADVSPVSSLSGSFFYGRGRCFYKRIASTGWVIVSYISFIHMLETLFWVLGIVTGLYLLSPFLYARLLIPMLQKQLSPIKNLSDVMGSFQAGADCRSEIRTGDEIEDLSDTFNKMVLEINRQVKDIRAQERQNSIISYKLLATQVDPHFIYNTMHIINVMARQGKMNEIIEVNTALTYILRERLSSKLSIHETIRHEYETMLQYARIMDYRYQHRIFIHYDIDEALMDAHIPKNILQPLVENSFYHGFADLSEDAVGNIDILIYSIDDEIIIEVNDNGAGISPERLRDLNDESYNICQDQKPHIGLDNIRQRLRYIYQDKQSMTLSSTPGFGTTIVITLAREIPDTL